MATFEEAHAHVALAPPLAEAHDTPGRGSHRPPRRRGRRGRPPRTHRRPRPAARRGRTHQSRRAPDAPGSGPEADGRDGPRRHRGGFGLEPRLFQRRHLGPERALLRHGAHPRGRSRLGHPRLREGACPRADPDRHRRARLGRARVALRPRRLHPARSQGRGGADRDGGADAVRLRGRASARPPPP